MAFVHGKDGAFTLNSVALSAFINNVSFTQTGDSHDVTTYGKDAHVKFGGLLDGSITVDGVYDNGVAGPHATIDGIVGTVVPFEWQPEGVGAGLPEMTGNCLVQSYVHTAPVADMISWSLSLEPSDNVTHADQI